MISQEEALARVARGAAHLDKVRPGWFNRIDVGTLTLHDRCGCIIGQLTGGDYAARSLDLNPDDSAFNLHVEDGFVEFTGDVRDWYRPLQDAWVEAIADRRLSTAVESQMAVDAVGLSAVEPVAVNAR